MFLSGQYLLYKALTIVKLMETDKRMVVARGWGEGEYGELLLNGYKITVIQDEYVLETCCIT